MAEAAAARQRQSADQEAVAVATSPTTELPESIRQAIAVPDVDKIAEVVTQYRGPIGPLVEALNQLHGNAFVQTVATKVPALAQATAAPGETPAQTTQGWWDRVRNFQGGSFELAKLEKPATTAATPTATSSPEPAGYHADYTMDSRVTALRDLARDKVGNQSYSTQVGTATDSHQFNAARQTDGRFGGASASNSSNFGANANGTLNASLDQGVQIGGNAGATAQLIGSQVAIHSKPHEYTLFGEAVTAQFHLGVDATVAAQSQGKLGLNVGWSSWGANAELTGAAIGSTKLTGAATLTWAKRAPSEYAGQMVAKNTWRDTLGKMVPSWMLNALPNDKVQGWLTSLIEMIISGSGGQQTVLGIATSGEARANLGLPSLELQGGSIGVKSGAGLTFQGGHLNVTAELARVSGLEMLTMLGLGGSTMLFQRFAPAIPLPAFLKQKLDSAGADPTGTAAQAAGQGPNGDAGAAATGAGTGGLAGAQSSQARILDRLKAGAQKYDGDHKLVDWQRNPNAGSREANQGGTGRDFSYTRQRDGQTTVLTGEAARNAANQPSPLPAATAPTGAAARVTGLARRVIGDAEVTMAGGQVSRSREAVSGSHEFGQEGGARAQLTGRALGGTAAAGGQVAIAADHIRVSGNASARVDLVGGEAVITTPKLPFTIFGEQVVAEFGMRADAGAFAEAQGNVALNVGWDGAAVNAGVSGFVGARAGLSGSGTLTWQRKAPTHYANMILESGAWKTLLEAYVPGWVLKWAPEKKIRAGIESLVSMMLNGSGDALIIGATMRGEGSAGVGAAATIQAGFRGGVLHCSGRAGLTFGVGAGASVNLALGVFDGMALLSLLAMRGSGELISLLRPNSTIGQFIKPIAQKMLTS